MPCEPALLVDGFPYLLACDTGYYVFVRMYGDRPLYAPISARDAVRLMYVARRLPGAEVKDWFFEQMRRLEHKLASREVMRAAMRAYKELKKEFPDVPRRMLLSAVLKAAWDTLFKKTRISQADYKNLLEKARENIMTQTLNQTL